MKQARGEYVIRVDGHTVIAPDYVRCCVEALQATGAHNVGGPMDPVGLTPMGKAIAAAGKSPFAVPSAFHVSQKAQYTDTVYMGAWPRQVLDSVGYYDSGYAINEDYELNVRIRQAGGQIYLSPDIKCAYYGRQTLGALAKQYYRYGKGKVATLRKHPGSLKIRHLVAPVFVAGLVVGALLSLVFPWARALWLSGILAYLAMALLFSYRIAAKTDRSLLARLPLVFAAMHLTWGAGFWVGLAQSFLSPAT
jgi:GT2 family glycosyltransferase